MSSQLSKEQLFALFAEIKEEQAQQFPLSERFLKQFFNAALLTKAKEYLNDGQISFLEHSSSFSTIDAQILGNHGNTFTQHIRIRMVKGEPSVEAQCTCSRNSKCRHIAAVLLKLKIDNSGGFGEEFLVNDWLNELETISLNNTIIEEQVLLFILEAKGKELVLQPKMSPYRPDGHYPLGRALTEQQLNSQVVPKGLLESDFRLLSWVRSQNTPGNLIISGEWGVHALMQMARTKRLFFSSSRNPVTVSQAKKLDLNWQASKSDWQLTFTLGSEQSWQLVQTEPPMYLDTQLSQIGYVQTALSGKQLAHMMNMPAIPDARLEQVVSRFQSILGPQIVPAPKHLKKSSSIVKTTDPLAPTLMLDVSDDEQLVMTLSVAKAKQVLKDDLQAKLSKSAAQLKSFGLVLSDPEKWLFTLPLTGYTASHWFEYEVKPQLIQLGWSILGSGPEYKVNTPKVTLELKRDSHHHILGKVRFDGQLISLHWDKSAELEANQFANKFHYVSLGDKNYAIAMEAYSALLELQARFSYYASSSQFKFPLSFARSLMNYSAVNPDCKDKALQRYLEELNTPQSAEQVVQNLGEQTFKLRDYQQQGLHWLSFLNRHKLGGILADDMGLGKTLQVIAYFISQHNILTTKPSLIVCPTSLVGNWQSEFARFAPHLPLLTIHGSQREKYFPELAKARFILTTYPLLKRDLVHYKALDFDSIVLDEAQYIKNESAQISKCVKQLSAGFKLCLSGTPVENNLLELKSLLDFVMPDVLGTKQQFKQYFQLPIERDNDRERASELKQLLAPFILRRTKADVVKELPSKTELVKELEFSTAQSALYQAVLSNLELKLLDLFREQGVERSKLAFLDALLKLRQICCHPSLVDANSTALSAKFEWLGHHLPIMLAEGRKVIIFSQFTSVLDLIAAQCTKQGIRFAMLTGQTRHRDKVISEFTQGHSDVFLISLKAGGTGLNLTQADTVIHFDPWWNPAVEAQATDRAYRIGQDKPVFVYKLIMNNSIEQKVYQMQKDKQALVDALFEDKSVSLSKFDEKQMLELLK
ncbi:DEAD/DEAH box helicase (plasmid) [Pseudoalteromonas xiamenensis]|uniref:DEAD/DEAH box helicase n=1 Tax=Pseudoalteromonas xiamenensis TaxID=882626 RepID=UPI0027E5107D|nr:DEAD/DEAH box helicase [Pseudoalteromonas xiamenensis]WMN62065.1 DEAD/DEAH box helicase [Pseudoalteromonas xiamenensis]